LEPNEDASRNGSNKVLNLKRKLEPNEDASQNGSNKVLNLERKLEPNEHARRNGSNSGLIRKGKGHSRSRSFALTGSACRSRRSAAAARAM